MKINSILAALSLFGARSFSVKFFGKSKYNFLLLTYKMFLTHNN